MGPFDRWPTGGGGFEYFYGFIGGETNQYYPALYEGTTPVEPTKTPEEGYHFTEDMTDKAIAWVRQQKSLMPDKPFFMYFAPGATHAPHHVPEEWSAKYKGQLRPGLGRAARGDVRAPEGARRDPARRRADRRGPRRSPPGTTCPTSSSRCSRARWRSTPASWSTPTTTSAGSSTRSRTSASSTTRSSTTSSATTARAPRATSTARFNEMIDAQRRRRARDDRVHGVARSTSSARPTAYNHYAVGWAHAMDTPYQWTKQVASHWGGTRNGTIVHWPSGIEAKGEIRSQFHHVIDVAPTVLEAAGLPEPTFVQRRPAEADARASACATRSTTRGAAERRETQYFEMFCNRGIYHQGWTAVTRHTHPVGHRRRAAAVRRRRLGALRHEHRLDPGARPRRRASGEARGAAARCS